MQVWRAGILAWGMLSAMPLAAQWFHYPTAGVPRLPDGKPNLSAPAPRTPDGKPDLSGIWLAGNALPCPKDLREGDDCIEKIPLSHEAVDFASNLPGGLPYQPWAAALVKQRVADLSKDDPHARCLPPNFPRAFAFPHLQKVIQIPGLLVILDEFNASYRQIFTDGRPLPDDPQPSWNGYSSAKWLGDTLVVDTIGFRDDLWLDMKGNPMTSAARVTERFRRPNYGRLEIEVTVNDPKAYTKPWTVTLQQTIKLDTELVDEICLENEKSVRHMTGK
ncbi:MAG TPA: hypothetical protein VK724_06350 [Bryobacteraceae bacterium]|jgi:hypothetical protein|nr:hypothetical protein [Bryobacteraceae bacterium]